MSNDNKRQIGSAFGAAMALFGGTDSERKKLAKGLRKGVEDLTGGRVRDDIVEKIPEGARRVAASLEPQDDEGNTGK